MISNKLIDLVIKNAPVDNASKIIKELIKHIDNGYDDNDKRKNHILEMLVDSNNIITVNKVDVKYIIENFKDDNIDKIRDSIETTINARDEDALIGLGVLFELLWNKLNEDEKKQSLDNIRNSIKELAQN